MGAKNNISKLRRNSRVKNVRVSCSKSLNITPQQRIVEGLFYGSSHISF